MALPDYLAIVAERAPEVTETGLIEQIGAGVQETFTTGAPPEGFGATILGLATAISELDVTPHLMLADAPEGIATVFGGAEVNGLIGSYLNTEAGASSFTIIMANNPFAEVSLDTVVGNP